jgi:hypothetical protein
MKYFSRRGQESLLVLYALVDLGRICARQEVIDHISRARWYEIIGEDLAPTRTSREARYRIDLAWARKDCVLRDYIGNFERNAWELNRRGRDTLDRAFEMFRSGKWDIGNCEFFTLAFKRIAVPGYESKAGDKKRVSMKSLEEYIDTLFG